MSGENKKICPILASGWLSNKYSGCTKRSDTFSLENLPKCFKEDCEMWDKDKGCCAFKNLLR